ncbi:MAG: lysylphosphatidylglycerol synthase transmembrane domain-containing protein [Planctomycetota bacterium]|jgi:uncharacterized protein (TIRG00374 family)
MHENAKHRRAPKGQTRKRILFIIKVCLALAILLFIMASVKVNDHLTLPEGTPYAGIHVGTQEILDDGDAQHRILFRKKQMFIIPVSEEEYLFEGTVADGKFLTAQVRGTDGTHVFSPDECEGIELRDGLITVLKKIDIGLWLLSNLVYFIAIAITAMRWGYLLKATDLPQSPLRAYRLTYIGVFFNNVIPGQTGGDLIRAYYLAKENKGRKTDSIISVLVDRGLGITALACIGAVVIPTDIKTFGPAAAVIYGFVGAVGLGSLVYFSKRLRKFFKLDRIMKKLPFQDLFRKIDRSIFLYRYRKPSLFICFMISFVIHLVIILAVWILGKGLGIDLPIHYYMAFIPIIFIISSLPLTPSGWGVGEALFVYFFYNFAGVEPVLALALSLVFRANATLQSILGGVFLLMEKERLKPGEMDMDLSESEEEQVESLTT